MLSHIITIPNPPEVFLWNPLIGRGMQIYEQSLSTISPHPALLQRYKEIGFFEEIPNIHELIPHRSRWSILVEQTLWHPIPSRRTSGGYTYQSIELSAEQTLLWKNIDGVRSVTKLSQELGWTPTHTHSLLLPLCTHEVQAIQLRSKGLGKSHQALLQLFSPPVPQNIRDKHMYDQYGGTDLSRFHDEGINNAKRHFDDVEITLAHALEIPHPSLGMQSFGAKLARSLCYKTKILPHTILELGPGTGALAQGWYTVHTPQRYIRMDASPTLLKAQQERLPHTEEICAHAPHIPLPAESIDLFLSNEVIADLSAASIDDPEAQKWISQNNITLEPQQNWINLGAWKLIHSVWNVLQKGGMAYISEFGDHNEIPTEAIHLNHPEVSIHFGQLREVAEKCGFETELISLPQLLQMDMQQKWMAKHSYSALRAYLHTQNQEIEARAYSPESFPLQKIDGLEWVSMYEPGPAPLPERILSLLLWKPVS